MTRMTRIGRRQNAAKMKREDIFFSLFLIRAIRVIRGVLAFCPGFVSQWAAR